MSEQDVGGRLICPVPIGRAAKEKTPFFLLKEPREYAQQIIGAMHLKIIQGPTVMLVCSTEVLYVGTAGLMQRGIEAYETTIRALIEKHSPQTVAQVTPMRMAGEQPVLNVRVEKLEDGLFGEDGKPIEKKYSRYGIMVQGWGETPGCGLHVCAVTEDDYEIPVPWFLDPEALDPEPVHDESGSPQSVAGA